MPYKNVLLASHDTIGARAAEPVAMAMCESGGKITHLVVVPDFWKGMQGDDWLNNASTQDAFGRYVEDQLAAEIKEHVDRLSPEIEGAGLQYQVELRQGKPDECLLEFCREGQFDLVIMGTRRPKGAEGFHSTMLTENLLRSTALPLHVVPYPHD